MCNLFKLGFLGTLVSDKNFFKTTRFLSQFLICQVIETIFFCNFLDFWSVLKSLFYHIWSYRWVETPGECSEECGSGVQPVGYECYSINSRTSESLFVESFMCKSSRPRSYQQSCNKKDCPPKWIGGDWSPCSEKCGPDGIQTRNMNCFQKRQSRLVRDFSDHQHFTFFLN